MYHYIELSCLADEGVPAAFILGKVMDSVHFSLVNLQKELGHNPVGVSFPEYRYGLNDEGKCIEAKIGSKLRLWSLDEAHLASLNLKAQLRRLEDYIDQYQNALERDNLSFASFQRVQVHSSAERLIRRRMKSLNQPLEQAQQAFAHFEEQRTELPYVNIHSQSSEQAFRLFIRKQTVQPSAQWQFSTYGLSATVGVPDT